MPSRTTSLADLVVMTAPPHERLRHQQTPPCLMSGPDPGGEIGVGWRSGSSGRTGSGSTPAALTEALEGGPSPTGGRERERAGRWRPVKGPLPRGLNATGPALRPHRHRGAVIGGGAVDSAGMSS